MQLNEQISCNVEWSVDLDQTSSELHYLLHFYVPGFI